MTATLVALSLGSPDPPRAAAFWAGLLRWRTGADGLTLLRDADATFDVRVRHDPAVKVAPNRAHLDLTSDSLREQRETVDRALALGATHLDVGQGADATHVVLADPDGNELCVLEPRNGFLAGCGFLGAAACDGSEAVGRFWSAALAWPLVWDQDEETAVQAPLGGPKITWGGPPVEPQHRPNRWHHDLAADGTLEAEVARLHELGATTLDDAQPCAPGVVLADPDGTEFCLLGR